MGPTAIDVVVHAPRDTQSTSHHNMQGLGGSM